MRHHLQYVVTYIKISQYDVTIYHLQYDVTYNTMSLTIRYHL